MKYLLNAFQKLRFCSSRIPQQQNINITSDFVGLNLLLTASEHSQSQWSLNSAMPINGGSNRIIDPFGQVRGFGKSQVFMLLCLVIQHLIHWILFVHVIGLNHCFEDRHTEFDVEWGFIPIDVDPCDLYLFTWLSYIDVVSNEDRLFSPRNPARQHIRWTFLNCQLLVISVDCFKSIFGKWTFRLAGCTLAKVYLFLHMETVNIVRSFFKTTFHTCVVEFFKLAHDLAPDGDHPFYSDQSA